MSLNLLLETRLHRALLTHRVTARGQPGQLVLALPV
jgi:hypothetical protein